MARLSIPPNDPRGYFATEVVERLQHAGFEALWAGGCVRDMILGQQPSDYDVATSARPEQVMSLFRRTIPVGVSFGVVRVRGAHPEAGEVEVATFRSDGVYIDGRRPESVVFSTAEQDAARRDFTINGMFLDPVSGELRDFVGGRADLEAGVLRAIGVAADRFREDKLRMLRAVRFAARFGFEIDSATFDAIKGMSEHIHAVAPERIADELRKILVQPNRTRGLNLAFDAGLVPVILPELVPMKGLFQGKPVQPEGDLWDHTMLVLENLPERPSFTLAFAALLHDVGKPRTKGLRDGRATFYNHEAVGKLIAEEICRRLKFSNEERQRIACLVEFHQYLGEARSLREAKLKRILATPGIEELLALHRADALASTGDTTHIDYCESYLQDQPDGPIDPPLLLTGHDLQRHGLEPGPRFKVLLDRVREAQLERSIQSKKDALALVDEILAGEQEQGGSGTSPEPGTS